MLHWIKLILDILFALSLVACAIFDWRTRTIPNLLPAFLSILGLAHIALLLGMGVSVCPHLIVLIVTVPLYFFWTMNWIGGGDVKLLFASAMYLGLWQTAIAAEIALLYLCFKLIRTSRKIGRNPRQKIALGPPLALGCVGCMAAQYVVNAIH
ncbi:MAG: prepilin peptidase [Clostridia bacterium]|nr:prepilin peptidase [Clostridia bacterium]